MYVCCRQVQDFSFELFLLDIGPLDNKSNNRFGLSRSCQGNSMHERQGTVGLQILKQLYEPLTSAFITQWFAPPQYSSHKSCGNCFVAPVACRACSYTVVYGTPKPTKDSASTSKRPGNREKLSFSP